MKLFDPNVTLLQASARIWPQACLRLFTMLTAAGWTIPRSGDGLSAFANGNVITNAMDTGANSIGNNSAWAVLRAPGTNGRELLFYTAANGTACILYSFAAGFTGGTATTPPTAADAVNVLGEASFYGGVSMYQGGGGDYRCSIMVDTEAPYGWWLIMSQVANTTFCHTVVMFDPIAPGTGVAGDTDPYVFVVSYDSTHGAFYNGTGNVVGHGADEHSPYTVNGGGGGAPRGFGAKAFLYKGTPNEEFRSVAWSYYANSGANPVLNKLGVNAYNGKDWLVKAPFAATKTVYATRTGWKGISSLAWFCGSDRALGDTFNVTAPRQYLYVNGMALDWDGSTIPLHGAGTVDHSAEFLELASAAAADTDPPEVSFSPPSGTQIQPMGAVDITVDGSASLFIAAQYGNGAWEVIHDGASFSPRFASSSSGGNPDARTFSITFPGGWPSQPLFKVWAGDGAGNQEQATATYSLPVVIAGDNLEGGAFDAYLATEGLRTAVIVSLFTDRRADDATDVPAGDGDLRGWWADAFSSTPGDRVGSRLWLLDRSKMTANLAQRAQEYAKEALAWMIEDSVASAVEVSATLRGRDVLDLNLTITRPKGDAVSFRFAHVWDAEQAGQFDVSIFEAAS